MHGFDIAQAHTSDHRLDVPFVPFPVIPPCVGSQVCDEIGNPKLEPGVHRHFGGGVINIVLVFVLCVCQPVAGFREGIKVLLPSGTVLG